MVKLRVGPGDHGDMRVFDWLFFAALRSHVRSELTLKRQLRDSNTCEL